MKRLALILYFLIPAASADEDAEIKRDIKIYDHLLNSTYGLFPHKSTYLLPFSYNATPTQKIYRPLTSDRKDRNKPDYNRKTEAEFQISFLVPIYRKILRTEWDVLTAYTHHAWWQVYSANWSRPFRETNYAPEIFARNIFQDPPGVGPFRLLHFDAGFLHHSNGQQAKMSRSWNRLFARSTVRYEDLSIGTTLWYRIPERKSDDDNRSIQKYYGLGELDIYKNFSDHTVGLCTPVAWTYYSLELKYSYPWRQQWRWYATLRSGHAMSLNDYNQETQRIGFGLILEDFVDK